MYHYCIVLILSGFIVVVSQQKNEFKPPFNPCLSKKTCGECIAVSSVCGWCQEEEYEKDRCDKSITHKANGCNSTWDLVDPDHKIDIIQDDEVRDSSVNEPEAIQIQPQRIAIKLRPNKPARFNVTFRQAANYPVDLYFLMDLSKSMEEDKETTAKLGGALAQAMLKLTNKVRLGFGSFVDKVTLPFTSTAPSKLKAPCAGCAPPYSFQHSLNFTTDINEFTEKVRAGDISGNLDTPEGGLDAMMQVAVCGERIGWRNNSRKLLIYSSDASFHSAGDGKLGGIVVPNDAQCHLSDSGSYKASLDQDYPSVGQMKEIIKENKINVIFAVTQSEKDVYTSFSDFLEGSTVGQLNKNSDNIVQLIQENYEKITSKVELKANHTEGIDVQYRSRCTGRQGSTVAETSVCEGLKIGESVTFEVTIEARECPSDPALRKRKLTIGPVGLTDNLIVELDIICDCDCEKPNEAVANSDKCSNGNGTFACGICSCNEGRRGRTCECGEAQIGDDDQDDDEICRREKSSLVCSGQGDCVCGQCQCRPRTPNSQQRFSGQFCECDDYSCDLYDGMLCGGPTRGLCRCGQCVCLPVYNGTSCGCQISQKTCEAPSGVKCNGQGECVCGKCKCLKESRCYGDFCEHCPSCVGNCNCNRDCVNCRLFKTGIYKPDECENKCSDIDITEVDVLEESDNATTCQEKMTEDDDSGCTFKFAYYYGSDNKLHINAQKIKVCPEPVDLLPIILGVTGGVLAIGLALLIIWKIFITAYDQMEYKRFQEEIDQAKWASEQNPLYREAIQTFDNPMCDAPSRQ